MKYVEIGTAPNAVAWDGYFEYLKTVEDRFPIPLREYVTNWGHYSLDGENSLHDAWLRAINFSHEAQALELEFLGARHDRRHVFRYSGVWAYTFDFRAEYRHGDRDVLVHEFRVESALFTHEIMFANQGRILVTAAEIFPEVGLPIQSGR